MNGKKRKKSAAGAALEDDLPDHLHYYGNTPKINKEFPGVFSTPVIPFISRQWNYSHWIYRTDDDNHRCLKCSQTIATGGNNDFSNSYKHLVTNHPEISAWEDVLKHTSIPITQYKLSLERNFRGKIVDSTLKKKTNSLGFPVTSTSKREKKIATQDMMIRACALGFLPLNFSSNLGGKIILEWGNGGSLPAGVSRPAITRRLQIYHSKKMSELSDSLSCFKHDQNDERPPCRSDDEHLTDRNLSLQQDIWSNAAQDAFLGNMVSGITVSPIWEMFTTALGVTPFDKNHTSKNTLDLTKDLLAQYDLKLTDIISCTTDTASAAFNTFDVVEYISQIPCFAHLVALLLKHAFESASLAAALQGIHDLVVLLKASPKRKSLLVAACAALDMKFLAPILDVITRWNSKEAMISRMIYLYPAVSRISAQEAFSRPSDRAKWNMALTSAEGGLSTLSLVLPFLVETSQWTQILSRRDSPTSSLVRVAVQSIKRSIEKMKTDVDLLDAGAMKTALIEIHASLVIWAFGDGTPVNTGYIGESYTDFWLFRVAEFLDSRTHKTVPFAAKKKVIDELLPELVLLSDTTVPRSTAQSRRAMTEEEKYCSGNVPLQTDTPLVRECRAFLLHMRDCNDADPLYFWTKHQQQFPILAPVARRVLAVPATSASTERLFSASGRVCTFDRASLKPANVDILSTLHVWERSSLEEDARRKKKQLANEKFCCLKIDDIFKFVLVPGTLDEYDDDDEDFRDDEEED